jgi:plasmid stabilization system protein ParE
MIGLHPSVRIELARWYRREQQEAAELRRIEACAAAVRPTAKTRRLGRAVPRLRPQQTRP